MGGHESRGEAVIISSVQLPTDDTAIKMPSLVYTLPGTRSPTTQTVAVIPMTDVKGLVATDVVALLQARFKAATPDIEVLLRLAADSTLEFSERYGSSYKLKWDATEANKFWSRVDTEPKLILASPSPLAGPAEHIMTGTFPHLCRDADGRAAHITTLYGKPRANKEKRRCCCCSRRRARRSVIT
jgi:hypothetical protein